MKNKNNSGLPNEIYIPFVESLYANRGVMYFGVVAQCVIAYAIGVESNTPIFVWFSWLFLIIGLARAVDYKFYDAFAKEDLKHGRGQKWENRYTLGVTMAALLIGVMTGVSIYYANPFAEFASMTLAMASMVTVVGKNFASNRLVLFITSAVFLPLFYGLLAVGTWTHIAGALLLLPFALSVFSMSSGLRTFLAEAVQGRLDVASIADKFDVALNNMPHGLIMFDNKLTSMVVNKRAADMLKSPSCEAMTGHSLKVILRFCRFRGMFGADALSQIEQRLTALLNGSDERKYLLKLASEAYVEFSAKRLGNGGGVLIFEDVSERILAEDKIHRMARFDSLTGLPNRTYFKELARANLAKAQVDSFTAFFVIDIDDFKHVNDSLGHPVGDELLCRFAERLNLLVGDASCFSRFGGDEFVGMFTGYTTYEAAEAASRLALSSLVGNYDVAGQHLAVTVSAGIVVTKTQVFDLPQLMIRADLALYESKSHGKGIATLFAESMDEKYQSRQRLKADLKNAIRDRKLNVFYQPIIDAETMRIATCEALCRWDHPELGPISPAVFIPLAEETGAITDLTRFMLEQACEDCKSWDGDVSVAVNLSAVDFRSSNITEMVRVALAKSRLPSNRLEVEVTEGAILEDQSVASRILNDLKKSGVRIALDDFGTGYSSLSYLHNLPLDKVKIDQSFVREITRNERSLKLVSGVTRLAKELGLTVTVEGVETLEQFEQLKNHAHVDLAQGFLFGAALSPRGIATLISNVFSLQPASNRRVAR